MNVQSTLVIDPAESVHYRQACDASPERVFDALTRRDLIEAWWNRPVRGIASVGGQLHFCFDGPRAGVVVEVTRAAEGAIDWLVTDDIEHGGEWSDNVIRFRVRSCGGQGSLIDFEQQGVTPGLASYEHVMRDWQRRLARLVALVESVESR